MRIPGIKRFSLRLMAFLLLQALVACHRGGSAGTDGRFEECFAGSGKTEVLDIMQSWYLWNDEADQFNKYRNLDVRAFGNSDKLLDYLRYRPEEFDRGFSYITTPEEEATFFNEGQFVGFGFGLLRVGNEIRISRVYPASPAAGRLERGYQLLEINGRSIAQIDAAEGLAEALGPDQVGFSLTFTVEDVAGNTLPPVQISKAVVTIDPVQESVLDNGMGNPVAGYILFNTFITSASSQLRAAFEGFGADNITRVVVDLRYNGGGLVDVAEVLGSLLIGPGHESDIFMERTFNSARAQFNERAFFLTETNALALDKIVFITSAGSASASELVINGLKPYFEDGDLALVGSTTYGKPVGQVAFDFCDDEFRLRAVAFKTVNADGEGDYFDGLPVDCAADDDLSHALGDPAEASLAAALEYMETGCPMSGAPGFTARAVTPKARPVTGPGPAQQFAGAF